MKKTLTFLIILFYSISSYALTVRIDVEIITHDTNKITVGYLLIKETNIYLISSERILKFKIIKSWTTDDNNYGYILENNNKYISTLTFQNGMAYLNIEKKSKPYMQYLELNIINP